MSYTKEFIYDYLAKTLEELFEVESESLTPESRLYEDLDIDSIDAVDLTVKLKEFTGKKITPSNFKDVRTVQDVVNAVHQLLEESEENTSTSE